MNGWKVIYVRSRLEKKVAERLNRSGFEVFFPTQTVLRQWSDRRKKVVEPLFKSYLFVQFHDADRIALLQTPGVVNIVHWLGKPAVVSEAEIQVIRDFLNDHKDISVTYGDLNPGDAVTINRGSFRQQSGVVVRTAANRVILQIDCLGVAVHAEVPRGAVEKV